MAVFESHYKELGFYVDGNARNFRDGRYVTEDAKEIEVLTALVDVNRVDKPQKVAEEKPKKATARKSSAK